MTKRDEHDEDEEKLMWRKGANYRAKRHLRIA